MRIESSITSVSWIPSEAVTGITKGAFEAGFAHYDDAPPDDIGPDIAGDVGGTAGGRRLPLRQPSRRLRRVRRRRLGRRRRLPRWRRRSARPRCGSASSFTVAAVSLPDRQHEPEIGDGWVRFTQSAGGRTGFPAPRAVRRPPFVQYVAPIAWSTLRADAPRRRAQRGPPRRGVAVSPPLGLRRSRASSAAKSGLIDYKDWAGHAFGKHTPWGDEESPALVTEVETALERQLSSVIMHGAAKPEIRRIKAGTALTEQGAEAASSSSCSTACSSSRSTASKWPRSARVRWWGSGPCSRAAPARRRCGRVTPCRVAAVPVDAVDRRQLLALSGGHRREEQD